MHRSEQINDILRGELARVINREVVLEGGLITISSVDCSPDLRQAKIGVSVLPDNLFGTALEKLRKNNKLFARELKKKIKLRRIPRLIWEADSREKHAAEIEEVLKRV